MPEQKDFHMAEQKELLLEFDCRLDPFVCPTCLSDGGVLYAARAEPRAREPLAWPS